MLHALRHPRTNEIRLYVRGVPVEAWISPSAPYGCRCGADWALFVRAGKVVTAAKCPLRLEVESHLKAWLLTRCGRPLLTLRFRDLMALATCRTSDIAPSG